MPETIEVVDDGGNIDDGLKWQIIFYGCKLLLLLYLI